MDENESFLPNFMMENNVCILDKDFKTPDIIQTIIEKNGPNGAFYIVNIGDIIRRVQLWRRVFHYIEPYYAVKSNPSPVICELLGKMGLSFDVASVEEINIVKGRVQDTSKIIFAHPIKPANSIVYARTVDVDKLVFDSEHELYKIKLHHPHSELFIRIKVDDKESECRFSEKFGVEQEDVEFLLDLAYRMGLNVVGISFHVGSNCKCPKQYYEAIKLAKNTFDIGKTVGFKMNIIDIGGGFSGVAGEEQLLITEAEIKRGLDEFFDNNIKVIAEPGRFFCTDSHTLVLSVVGKKVKKDKGEKVQTIYINDGTYGSFSSINYDHQKPEIIPYNNDDVEKYKTIIQGQTCDSVDKICENIMLPELEISDLVYVEKFGAYTTASSTRFNGFSINDFYYVMT